MTEVFRSVFFHCAQHRDLHVAEQLEAFRAFGLHDHREFGGGDVVNGRAVARRDIAEAADQSVHHFGRELRRRHGAGRIDDEKLCMGDGLVAPRGQVFDQRAKVFRRLNDHPRKRNDLAVLGHLKTPSTHTREPPGRECTGLSARVG